MGDLFGDIYSQSTNTNCDRALRDDIHQETLMYERETSLPTYSVPLAWWKTAQVRFTHKALLARRYLSIPGTLVRAETVFSKAGIVVDKKRLFERFTSTHAHLLFILHFDWNYRGTPVQGHCHLLNYAQGQHAPEFSLNLRQEGEWDAMRHGQWVGLTVGF